MRMTRRDWLPGRRMARKGRHPGEEIDDSEEAEDVAGGPAHEPDAQEVLAHEKDREDPLDGLELLSPLLPDGGHAFEHDGHHAQSDGPEKNDVEGLAGPGFGLEDDLPEFLAQLAAFGGWRGLLGHGTRFYQFRPRVKTSITLPSAAGILTRADPPVAWKAGPIS